MPTASTSSVQAASDRRLTRVQAEAAVAQRLQVLGHAPDLLDRQAIACLLGFARGSERQLRTDLAAVLFVASTEDAPNVDAALVRRALQTGLREAEQAPARSRWASVWRRAWDSVTPPRRAKARSDVWKDDFRLSLAAACIAALASIVFVIYERSGHGGGTTRPPWADRFAVQGEAPHAGPAAPLRSQAPAVSDAGSAARGSQRLASTVLQQGQTREPGPSVFEAGPPVSAEPGQAGVAGPGRAGPVRPHALGRQAASPTASRETTDAEGTDAVAPTEAEIAGLRQLQASASTGGQQPAPPSSQPGAPATGMAQVRQSDVSATLPHQPARVAASPAAASPASPTPGAPAPPSLASNSLAPPPIAPGLLAPGSPVAAGASAGEGTQQAALSALPPPVNVRALPFPPSGNDVPTHQAAAGRLRSTAAAAVLLLYPDRDAEALRRLRPLAIRLQEEGITNIRARPTRALPARRAISYFYTDDEPLAHVIAQTLSKADWPQLNGNSLQPSLVLLPPGLHPRRPGTIEIQLP